MVYRLYDILRKTDSMWDTSQGGDDGRGIAYSVVHQTVNYE